MAGNDVDIWTYQMWTFSRLSRVAASEFSPELAQYEDRQVPRGIEHVSHIAL